jgi:hypothetical protein
MITPARGAGVAACAPNSNARAYMQRGRRLFALLPSPQSSPCPVRFPVMPFRAPDTRTHGALVVGRARRSLQATTRCRQVFGATRNPGISSNPAAYQQL